MLQLALNAITPGAWASDKKDAIRQVSIALAAAGNVSGDYLEAMLEREKQTSTYLGNGIAIPHGTIHSRHLVLQTGIQVFQFPHGVDWGEQQIAYIVIGIAAKSDEHLELLRQITHALNDESLAQKLKNTDSAKTLRSILIGEKDSTSFSLDASLITTDIASCNLITLQAINAGLLKQAGLVDNLFLSQILSDPPLNLGQGIWLSESSQGNLINGIAISRAMRPFDVQGDKVSLLITISIIDEKPLVVLSCLSRLLINNECDQLFHGDAYYIIELLTNETLDSQELVVTKEFIINNQHGLHARPGAVLVNLIKGFNCKVSVINLNGNGQPANGRSLMKMVALGVKRGHRLRFIARGEEAQKMMLAVTEAIANGLGENKNE
ncbi:fused PTS fructose transporter subunit IIA/HPr protein [Candidatus Erwinia haradaeae]|uniref:Multiphosphoryl transfer protein n=1 Tax=Candidatus Erwinia haradaeae TaxID=1922217 RepID=A0A451DHX6_9GAMM|nr:fused PTS fructose transporter subunit IIA/HPr protein [Candidatus Erwinia haradaeae]VFP86225.1 Multiphosphoryl transfer protein [Candidatus Erwinia haradaeae]